MSSVTRPMIGVWIEDESTVITSSHGMRRPNGGKSGLKIFPFLTGGSGVSVTTLSDGSGGGVPSGFESAVSIFRSDAGVAKGIMSRRTVSGSCGAFAPALAALLAVDCRFESNVRRLFTMSRTKTRPNRKSVTAPVGERKKLIKRRGFIAVSESVQLGPIQAWLIQPVLPEE